jgi:acylphosphatase
MTLPVRALRLTRFDMATLHLIVTGRVQGVGYRDALRKQAQRRGVAGWVRNRRDGSVEALLQGTQDAVDATIAWARHGPALARVLELRMHPESEGAANSYPNFEVRPTA